MATHEPVVTARAVGPLRLYERTIARKSPYDNVHEAADRDTEQERNHTAEPYFFCHKFKNGVSQKRPGKQTVYAGSLTTRPGTYSDFVAPPDFASSS